MSLVEYKPTPLFPPNFFYSERGRHVLEAARYYREHKSSDPIEDARVREKADRIAAGLPLTPAINPLTTIEPRRNFFSLLKTLITPRRRGRID
jgi:hypothetical protein